MNDVNPSQNAHKPIKKILMRQKEEQTLSQEIKVCWQ